MYRHKHKFGFVAVCSLLLFNTRAVGQSFDFTAIDAPCSAAPPTSCPNGIALLTAASGINPAGDVVGFFNDGVGRQHGFLLSAGQFTAIDFPGATNTSANGISPSGEIVGNYTAPYVAGSSNTVPTDSPAYCPAAGSPACTKGFLYRRGKFSTVLFPGHPGAVPQHITPDGDIYGCLHDFDFMNSMFGAAWRRLGEISLTVNGGELADQFQSKPSSMNNGATPGGRKIVGLWDDMDGNRHGFIVEDGAFQSYDVPGSILTAIWDISPTEQFVGTYVDTTGHRHGFVQPSDGSAPITVDYPKAAATVIFGINPEGVIVGRYTTSGHTHGFRAVPAERN